MFLVTVWGVWEEAHESRAAEAGAQTQEAVGQYDRQKRGSYERVGTASGKKIICQKIQNIFNCLSEKY